MDTKQHHLLSIGRFAKAAQLSLKALRLYDRKGIFKPAYVAPESGYRYYRIEQLEAARVIRSMRQMEMPLPTIRQVFTADSDEAEEIVSDYLRSFEQRAERVRSTARTLISHLNHKEAATMAFEIGEKDVAPQQIVSISKHVYVGQLDSHIKESVRFLREYANRQGGEIVGPAFGIYHGPVNREDNGPVEVCLPVRGKFSVSGEVVSRECSGGSVAYVTVEDEQCQFPGILQAYDAVHDWITRKGCDIEESPREIWMDSEKMKKIEIAWPFRKRA
jgi:DNA-binding transcriptional MerR regulator